MKEKIFTMAGENSEPVFLRGKFDVSVSGDFTGAVILQRSLEPFSLKPLNASEGFKDSYSFIESEEKVAEVVASYVRFRTSNDFTGNCVCKISQG